MNLFGDPVAELFWLLDESFDQIKITVTERRMVVSQKAIQETEHVAEAVPLMEL